MSPAKLARRCLETARDKAFPSAYSAQVNHGGQSLLLRQAGLRGATSGQRIDYALVQIRGGQFGGVARQSSRVEAVEPAGTEIVPRAIVDDLMIPDAILARLGKGAVGDLKHAEGAGGRTIDFERIPGPAPTPIGAGDRIAAAFDLRQSGEEFSRDNARGIFLEERPVMLPGRFRALGQGAADGRQEFAGLAHHLIDPIEREKSRHPKRAVPDHRRLPVEPGDPYGLSPEESNAARDDSHHVELATSLVNS